MKSVTVSRWGDNLAVRLPRSMAAGLRIEAGKRMRVEVRDGQIVLTPLQGHYRIEDLLAGVGRRQFNRSHYEA